MSGSISASDVAAGAATSARVSPGCSATGASRPGGESFHVNKGSNPRRTGAARVFRHKTQPGAPMQIPEARRLLYTPGR
jgi:hypothetical protein